MSLLHHLNAAEDADVVSNQSICSDSSRLFGVRSVFAGPHGLRSGWRLLMFFVLFGTLFGGFVIIRAGGPQGFREQYRNQSHMTITPFIMIGSEAITLLFLCISALAMAKLEHRKLSDYGLPLRRAVGRDFGLGTALGFFTISGTLLAMFLLHGFTVRGRLFHGTAIVSSLLGWGIAFLLVGLVEEFLCRGYIKYTLASGIGFWPAAFRESEEASWQ